MDLASVEGEDSSSILLNAVKSGHLDEEMAHFKSNSIVSLAKQNLTSLSESSPAKTNGHEGQNGEQPSISNAGEQHITPFSDSSMLRKTVSSEYKLVARINQPRCFGFLLLDGLN